MKYSYIIFLIASFNIIACNNNKKENSQVFSKSQDIAIERNKNTPAFSRTQYLEEKNDELLLALNERKKSIYVYNLETKELEEEINVPVKEKYSIADFYAVNLDSIYFIPKNTFKIGVLSNRQEKSYFFDPEMSKILEFKDKFDLGKIMEFTPTKIAALIIKNSKLLVPNMINPNGNLSRQRPLYVFDLSSDEIDINSEIGRYPKKFMKQGKTIFPFHWMSFCRNESEQTICNFLIDDTLYVYDDSNSSNPQKFSCKSDYISDLPKQRAINKSRSTNINKKLIENSFYQGIYYDKYRDVYYRIAKLKHDYKDDEGYINKEKSRYSIMVINQNFEVCAEQIFNHKDYLSNSLLVTKEGILLKKPDNKTGVSRYTLFKLDESCLK